MLLSDASIPQLLLASDVKKRHSPFLGFWGGLGERAQIHSFFGAQNEWLDE